LFIDAIKLLSIVQMAVFHLRALFDIVTKQLLAYTYCFPESRLGIWIQWMQGQAT